MKEHRTVTILAVVVAVLATLLVVSALRPRYALGQVSEGAAGGMVGLVSEQRNARSPLFLIDTKAQTVMIYEYDQSIRRFYLRAVRSYRNDRRIDDMSFHAMGQNKGPTVKEAEKYGRD